MPTTAALAIPYPALSDAPNSPSQLQANAERVEALMRGPRCRIRRNVDSAVIAAGASADNAYHATMWDTNGMADLAGNRIVIKTAGVYTLTAMARVILAANDAEKDISILVNGVRIVYSSWRGFNGALNASVEWPCAVNDLITTRTFSETGGYQLLGSSATASENTFLSATLVTRS